MFATFELPRFYPILDTRLLVEWSCPLISAVEGLIDAGVRTMQLRHKDAWTQTDFDVARQMAKLCREAGVLFVLNDRADFAKLLGTALHVGQDDVPPVAARRLLGEAVIGFSTHNLLQLTRANDEPVDYIAVGPIFETTSKLRPDPSLGVDGFKKLRPFSSKPVVAIGGITQSNACAALKAGADSVAVISALGAQNLDRKAMRRSAETWIGLLSQASARVERND